MPVNIKNDARKNAKLITVGNLEDDLKLINDADLIIEVVLEKLEIKHDVFQKMRLMLILVSLKTFLDEPLKEQQDLN